MLHSTEEIKWNGSNLPKCPRICKYYFLLSVPSFKTHLVYTRGHKLDTTIFLIWTSLTPSVQCSVCFCPKICKVIIVHQRVQDYVSIQSLSLPLLTTLKLFDSHDQNNFIFSADCFYFRIFPSEIF